MSFASSENTERSESEVLAKNYHQCIENISLINIEKYYSQLGFCNQCQRDLSILKSIDTSHD